jgi:hypothetical protein
LDRLEAEKLASRVPLRVHLNVGYWLDNSALVAEEVEDARGFPLTRLERLGAGLNHADRVLMGLGLEGEFALVRPFVEWGLGIPVERQSFRCAPSRIAPGERCLNDVGFSAWPSTLTLGARVYPAGAFNVLGAADIGTSGTATFAAELSPTLPWTAWLGLGHTFDTSVPWVEGGYHRRRSAHVIDGLAPGVPGMMRATADWK